MEGADFTEEMHEVFQLLLDEVAKSIREKVRKIESRVRF